jgi:hypothetical protein
MPEIQSQAEGEGAVICDLPAENELYGSWPKQQSQMCGLTIAHESPPGTGLALGTPQSNTVQGAT